MVLQEQEKAFSIDNPSDQGHLGKFSCGFSASFHVAKNQTVWILHRSPLRANLLLKGTLVKSDVKSLVKVSISLSEN